MRNSGFLPSLLAAFLTVASISACAQAALQPNRVDDAADPSLRTSIPGHLPTWAAPANDTGIAPAATPLNLTFVLSRSATVQAAFEQFLADQQNPASPYFHQWLTPQQVGTLYGPTQHDVDALTRWLTANGFSVTEIAPSRVFVSVKAPAATVATALGTSFHLFNVNGESHLATTAEPSLPRGLAPVVAAIVGLVDDPARSQHHIQSGPVSSANQQGPSPLATSSSGAHYVTPGDFATIFDINAARGAGYNGTGQKVAIIGRARVLTTDISQFETNTALPANVANVVIPTNGVDPGPANPSGTGDQGEATLDVQRVIGVAPNVQADLVVSLSTTTDGIFIASNYNVQTLLDPVMTISFGSCEANRGSASVAALDTMFSQAASEGITTLVSSGDSAADTCIPAGSTPPTTQILNINSICSSSYVTCVGGTELIDTANPSAFWSATNGPGLVSALGYIPEGVWNEFSTTSGGVTSYRVLGGGGGVSAFIAKPSWQAGVGVPADGFRDVPDVSFPSASHDGYYTCYAGSCASGSFYVFSGTSAAAPGMAGVVALLNQKTNGRQGNLNPLLYRLAASTSNNVFHDATVATSGVVGCNAATASLCNNSTPSATAATGGLAGYLLTAGYDLATGWGSIDVNNLLINSGKTYTPTTGALASTPATITIAQTASFSATFTGSGGTPTGTVQFASNGANLGAPASMTAGVATLSAQSFTLAGTYTITATYSGDSTFAASTATFSLIVTNPAAVPSTSALTASLTSATTAQAVSFTDAVSGSKGVATGTVKFIVDGVTGASTALSAGQLVLSPALYTAGTHTVSAVYSGDSNYTASTSNTVTLIVTNSNLPTSTSISINPSTVTPTGSTIIGGTVTGTGGPIPTGSTSLTNVTTGQSYGSIPITNGSSSGLLSIATLGLAPGTYQMSLKYSGDTVYAASTSPLSPLTITGGSSGALATTTSISINPSTVTTTGSTIIGGTVTGTGGPIPTGSLTLTNSTTGQSYGSLTMNNGSVSGLLSVAAIPLAPGGYQMVLKYSGDAVYATSTSPYSLLFVTGTTGTVALSPSVPSLSLTAGGSATDNVVLLDSNFAGLQTLTCSVAFAGSGGSTNTPTCTFNPSSFTLTGSGSSSTVLSISSTAASVQIGAASAPLRRGILPGLGGMVLATLLMSFLPRRNRRRLRTIRLLSALLFLAAGLTSVSGCSSGSIAGPSSSNPGTTKGPWNITINTTGSSSSGTVAYTGIIPLTIQ